MSRRPETAAPDAADAPPETTGDVAVAPPTPAAAAALGSLADLPVAGLTRRRIGFVIGAVVVAWIVVLFARQVSEASAATARAEELRASNAALASEITALEDELDLITRQAYVAQQARAHRLGGGREIAFTLDPAAPSLAPDAPGMAAVRLGARDAERRTPLESWLELLFGPAG